MISKIHKIIVIISLLMVFGLSACSPEKKLAIEFVSKTNTKSILVIMPEYIFKKNLKTFLLDSIEVSDNSDEESALLGASKYMAELNDSLFLANYTYGFLKSLNKFGFNVYNQNQIDKFLAIDSNTYQINIAQIELEETLYSFRDDVKFQDSYYFHDHELNAVYINTWFEFNNLNETNSDFQIYFTTDLITDIPDGAFEYDIFSNKVRYMYNIDSLESHMIYDFAYKLGNEYAKYTFDLLLNNELNKKIPEDVKSNKYWRYDPTKHTFFIATDDRFLPMEN